MRICFVTDSFPNYLQPFVLNQVFGAIDTGHEVDVIARHFGDLAKNSKTRRQLSKRMRVVRFSGSDFHSMRSWIDHTPGHFLFWSMVSLYTAMKIGLLPEYSLCHRYDIIHAQTGNTGIWAAQMMKCGLLSGKLVVSIRGRDVTSVNESQRAEYKELFQKASLLLPSSSFLQKKLVSLGAQAEQCPVLYSAVDSTSFPQGNARSDSEILRFITVGRLVEKKGHAYALRALSELKKQGLAFEYRIVGDGPMKRELAAMARELDLEKETIFTGTVDHPDVLKELHVSDIFLATSVTASTGDSEGIPNSLKEAMLAGVLCIATDHGGTTEIILHNETGFLVPEKDPAALKDMILTALLNRQDWERLSTRARSLILASMDQDKLTRELMGHYETACRNTLNTEAK